MSSEIDALIEDLYSSLRNAYGLIVSLTKADLVDIPEDTQANAQEVVDILPEFSRKIKDLHQKLKEASSRSDLSGNAVPESPQGFLRESPQEPQEPSPLPPLPPPHEASKKTPPRNRTKHNFKKLDASPSKRSRADADSDVESEKPSKNKSLLCVFNMTAYIPF
ncbi:hypothetical protein BN14_11492 [Rhizoctonia solani AG-1 IB]|uniref:Uncharacterized protein n=1 Tax=Thanatephorus cucumeris (strain AG1-IB / isolate 7/3/14) TaxID=1108050 RepID=M5CH67_THACB|nr:hypothetical protein BN14_11492 [Rhizoctonia solani AG-1 IB]